MKSKRNLCLICGGWIYFAAGRWLHETTPWDPPHPALPANNVLEKKT